MAKKRNHWAKKLTKAEKQHLKDGGHNLVTLEPFIRTLKWQKEKDIVCNECRHIAVKLGINF